MPLETLGPEDMQLGGDPDMLRRELLVYIRRRVQDHPRSGQRTIGPSELGMPCLRRLGFRLAEMTDHLSAPKQGAPSWRPTVGTAVHTWLAETFDADNELSKTVGRVERWVVERRVRVGDLLTGEQIWGSCDLYDRITATVVDWKIVGAATLRKVTAHGAPPGYRTQVQLYGQGFRNEGLPVERVGVMFLPSSGELHQSVWWGAPFDETVAAQALSRASGIAMALAHAGRLRVIPALPTAEHYCTTCPWYNPSTNDPSEACRGHEAQAQQIERMTHVG